MATGGVGEGVLASYLSVVAFEAELLQRRALDGAMLILLSQSSEEDAAKVAFRCWSEPVHLKVDIRIVLDLSRRCRTLDARQAVSSACLHPTPMARRNLKEGTERSRSKRAGNKARYCKSEIPALQKYQASQRYRSTAAYPSVPTTRHEIGPNHDARVLGFKKF